MAGRAGPGPHGGDPFNGGFHGGDPGRGFGGGVRGAGPFAGLQRGPLRSFDGVGPGSFNGGVGNPSVTANGVGNPSVTASGNGSTWGGAGGSLNAYSAGYYAPQGAYVSANAYPSNASSYGTSPYYAYGTAGTYANSGSGSSAGDSSQSSTYASYSPAGAETAAPADTSAYLTVDVPADAQVWVDGQLTPQTGTSRQFYTPPLTPGQNYTYEVRARWTEDGRPVERVRQVPVSAGASATVVFVSPN